jgi:hypothetical protein
MRGRALIGGTVAVAALAVSSTAAHAIRYGEPDNGAHPYVGLMVAYGPDGPDAGDALDPLWRCSGTMIDPTHFLTAGHCTSGAEHVEIWFDEDLTNAAAHNYPGGPGDASGTPIAHPEFDEDAFFRHDLGVVVLDEPYTPAAAPDGTQFGALPELGYLDQFLVVPGQNPQTFTAVGYGLQRNMPEPTGLTSALRIRLQAPSLQIINQDAAFGEKKAGNSVLFTNNAHTGGTCNGDSGGPVFAQGTNVVVAVNSYVLNGRCAGTAGGYRVDTADDLNWLAEEFGLTPG